MKKPVFTFFVSILFLSCSVEPSTLKVKQDKTKNNQPKKSPIELWIGHSFTIGSSLGGGTFKLNKNQTFEQYGFCDICPVTRSFGKYEIRNDTLIKTDTLCYTIGKEFSTIITFNDTSSRADTTFCKKLKTDTLYYWETSEVIGFKDYTIPNKPISGWELENIINKDPDFNFLIWKLQK